MHTRQQAYDKEKTNDVQREYDVYSVQRARVHDVI